MKVSTFYKERKRMQNYAKHRQSCILPLPKFLCFKMCSFNNILGHLSNTLSVIVTRARMFHQCIAYLCREILLLKIYRFKMKIFLIKLIYGKNVVDFFFNIFFFIEQVLISWTKQAFHIKKTLCIY